MSKKNTYLLLAVTAVLISSLGCTVLDSILPNVLQDDPAPAAGDSIRISDDFSNESTGWEVGSFDGGDIGYHDGTYRVTSIGDGSTMWGAAGLNFQDLMIEVDAKQIVGPENNNNDYGIVCRLQRDGGGYYGLVSGDGFYAILRDSGDTDYQYLVDWTESRLINQGNSSNRLGMSCQGSKIALFVNGKLVAETSDKMFDAGDVGLTATSYEPQGTVVDFDNFSVR